MILGFIEGAGEGDRRVCLQVAVWPILESRFVYVRNVL